MKEKKLRKAAQARSSRERVVPKVVTYSRLTFFVPCFSLTKNDDSNAQTASDERFRALSKLGVITDWLKRWGVSKSTDKGWMKFIRGRRIATTDSSRFRRQEKLEICGKVEAGKRRRYVHDQIRPSRLTAALGLKTDIHTCAVVLQVWILTKLKRSIQESSWMETTCYVRLLIQKILELWACLETRALFKKWQRVKQKSAFISKKIRCVTAVSSVTPKGSLPKTVPFQVGQRRTCALQWYQKNGEHRRRWMGHLCCRTIQASLRLSRVFFRVGHLISFRKQRQFIGTLFAWCKTQSNLARSSLGAPVVLRTTRPLLCPYCRPQRPPASCAPADFTQKGGGRSLRPRQPAP